ncbi:MAG: hypothetical protein COB54_02660 [Alphaproteobacteria bacterium]|nr:MAG: hypothetical protein COB54_02660 [Alphaproteobacteria bacterium]
MTGSQDLTTAPMAFDDLEQLYDLMADTLDKVGPDQHSLFLSKLVMILAHRMGDLASVTEAITLAEDGL